MTIKPLVLSLSCTVLASQGGVALAQTFPETESAFDDVQPPDTSTADTTHRLEWHWRRVHWAEVAGAAALTVVAITVTQTGQPAARWTDTNGFDNWFQSRLRVDGTTQRRVDRASDVFALTLIAFPILADSVGVALIGDKNKQVAGQLLAIQAQAFAMTGFLTSVTKRVASRERPDAHEQGCDDFDLDCGSSANRSYFSGHTSFAFTGAGLTCVEHKYLNLFGRVGDPLACGSALALASVTALFRIMADAHWATDVLTGVGVGLFSGWLVPWLMHFRHGTSKRDADAMRALRYLAPYGGGNEFGLSVAGAF